LDLDLDALRGVLGYEMVHWSQATGKSQHASFPRERGGDDLKPIAVQGGVLFKCLSCIGFRFD
jgi:hypothetical protein